MTQEEYDNYIAQRVQQAEQRENNRKHIVGTLEHTRQATYAPRVKQNVVQPIQVMGEEKKTRHKGDMKETAQKKTVKIILPFRLPTWNMLLAANPWQRKKVRDWIHAAMCTLEVSESDSLTPMELVLRPRLTASCIESYCRMITPKSSTKSVIAKSKRKRIGRKLR